MTEVSVLLPVRNGASTIADQLEALAAQDFDGEWELLVVDNGSTDATRTIVEGFADRLPLRIVDASERRGTGYARNRGVAASSAAIVALCDADDVVWPGWLRAITAAGHDHELVAGGIDHHRFVPGIPEHVAAASRSGPIYGGDWMDFAIGANMAVQRAALDAIGGFDDSLPCSTDRDLSWRLQVAGHELYFEPDAVVSKRPRATFGQRFVQHYRWGKVSATIYRRMRPHGMPGSNYRFAILEAWWVLTRVPLLAVSPRVRRQWPGRAADRAGRLVGSVKERVLYV
jgi:glycosyltransferase involved in cell wall biosynthesis